MSDCSALHLAVNVNVRLCTNRTRQVPMIISATLKSLLACNCICATHLFARGVILAL